MNAFIYLFKLILNLNPHSATLFQIVVGQAGLQVVNKMLISVLKN